MTKALTSSLIHQLLKRENLTNSTEINDIDTTLVTDIKKNISDLAANTTTTTEFTRPIGEVRLSVNEVSNSSEQVNLSAQ